MSTEAATLLVDNSNTRTKFRLCKDVEICKELRICDTQAITTELIRHLLDGWSFSSVYVSSVVPRTAAVLKRAFSCPVRFVSVGDDLPVDFSHYEGRNTLGADRIANAIGTLSWNKFPAVAVDLGTAVTFDIVTMQSSGKPRYLGGMITPGLAAYRGYLAACTALLPRLDAGNDAPSIGIGMNTVQAMRCGLESGGRGMIRGVLSDIESVLGERPFVIATGGDAGWAASRLPEISIVDSLLTFRGLSKLVKTES